MLKNDKREVKTAKKKQHCIKTRPRPGPWNLDLRKIRPLKKHTHWKNRTKKTSDVAIVLKSYGRQCQCDSVSYKMYECFRANNV